MHFIADMKGYWKEFPERARMVGWGAGALILCAIAAGFFIMGTPGQVRLYRFDDQKVQDLQNIQSQIVNYWQQKEKLPTGLSELDDKLSGNVTPVDPQSGEAYKYSVNGLMTFELCATFNADIQPSSVSARSYPKPASTGPGVDLESQPWNHGAGEICFTRTIDPERYPPYKK
jgi:hypothetical protein